MDDIQNRFDCLGLHLPEILLPREDLDPEKWAVIACDQFTQDRMYWEKVKNAVAGAPSALNLIYPEVFLPDGDSSRRIDSIHRTMKQYLAGNVFSQARTGCVYVERNTPFNAGRRGLVIAVDLERYDWKTSARTLIRCTEGTVPERLPPRMDIRRSAALETSHVLLLIDDDQDRLLPALARRAKSREPIYRSTLMLGSGEISGWFLDSNDDWSFIAAELEELSRRSLTRYKSGHTGVAANSRADEAAEKDAAPFLFAAGDGNHSLAAAKEIWEEYKKNCRVSGMAHTISDDGLPVHPCRYTLVEIENLYDPAVKFEPIHRVVFGLDHEQILALLSGLPGFSVSRVSKRGELVRLVHEQTANNRLGIIARSNTSGGCEPIYTLVETSARGLVTASLQPLLDNWMESQKNAANGAFTVDYIHGEEELFRIVETMPADNNAVGILLPPVQKSGLFETAANSGPLPRKSFSIGDAGEKRFYLECRQLFG